MKLDVNYYIEKKRETYDLSERRKLLIIQVGDDPASNLYINSKMREAEKWNIECIVKKFKEDVNTEDIKQWIRYGAFTETFESFYRLSQQHRIGIIVQLPVPDEINYIDVLESSFPILDVEGFINSNSIACTPRGIYDYLNYLLGDLEGKHVVLIGRGETVGKPLTQLLLKENCTLTVCNSHTTREQLNYQLAQADIVISAVGKPNLFSVYDLKENTIVIDAGISRVKGKQVGDFSHDGDLNKVYYTPWTNGVGKLTVAALMQNVREL